MLEYAAARRQVAPRPSSPHAMLVIISAHVAVLALVMSAKMDLPARIHEGPIRITLFPRPIDPPPLPQPNPHPISHPTPMPQPLPLPLPPIDGPIVTSGPIDPGPMIIGGGGSADVSGTSNPIKLMPVRHDARLFTRADALKPPYPASKILSEEEAVLTLRLTIDERGRVIAVEPVGRADSAFLDAARRHLVAHWRYQPATEDGRPVASSTTITLRFQLDG
jgi:protein TonB